MKRISILPLATMLALSACGKPAETGQAADEPTAPSSEWVQENPTEPAVPVDLPTTPMTNAPAAEASPAASASGN
jgi:hypothetical protein